MGKSLAEAVVKTIHKPAADPSPSASFVRGFFVQSQSFKIFFFFMVFEAHQQPFISEPIISRTQGKKEFRIKVNGEDNQEN